MLIISLLQPGNPQPRFFRLPEDKSVINRYGFNSEGHLAALSRLRDRVRHFIFTHPSRFPDGPKALAGTVSSAALVDAAYIPRSLRPGQVLGVNLGKNKNSAADDISDYVEGVKTLGPFADMVIINVSSPNTPGLRGLQKRGVLEDLLRGVVKERDLLAEPRPPLLVKIAPDLDDEELEDVAQAAMSAGIDGVIISNTTIQRPSSLAPSKFSHALMPCPLLTVPLLVRCPHH